MWVIANGKQSIEIEDEVIRRVLGIYPEEELERRDVFAEAFLNGRINYKDLKEESGKILVPWQMFFLTKGNLDAQIRHIERQRVHKVSQKILAKRKGTGEVTSRRIVDRLIRQQNFLLEAVTFQRNGFCGSLKNQKTFDAASHVLEHFSIDRSTLWKDKSGKGWALEYLIGQVDAKAVNVARGVLTNKMLPHRMVVSSDVYRNTSGFVIRDDKVPFVFLPSEINPDEVESRQIYTLIYLLAIVGLEQYEYVIDKDSNAKMLGAKGVPARLHAITTEVLMPASEMDTLRGQTITAATIENLSRKLKVSPTALVTTLRIRKIISEQEFEDLKPQPYVPRPKDSKDHAHQPKVTTSIKKFCGQITFETLCNAIRSGSLTSVRAQHLIWGGANKEKYREFRNEMSL